MRVSKRCQYALRAVFELALRNAGQPIKIHDIAGAQNIPPRFLEVILNQLRHAGFVDSRRGNEGCYFLVCETDQITVKQIIQCLQGPISVIDNDKPKNKQNGSFFGDYAFEQLWQKINSAVSQICHNTTFAELVEYEKAKKTAGVANYTI